MSYFANASYFADLQQAVNPTQDFASQHASTSASSQRAEITWPGFQELMLFAARASAAEITSEMIADEAFIQETERQLDPQILNVTTAPSTSQDETFAIAPPTLATTSGTTQDMQPSYTLQPTSDTHTYETPVYTWPDSSATTPGEGMSEQMLAALTNFIQQAQGQPNILQHPPINPSNDSTQPNTTTTSPNTPPSDQGGFYPLPFPLVASSSSSQPPAEVAPRKGKGCDSAKKTLTRAKPYETDNLVGLPPIRCLWEGCNQTMDADRKQWNAHFRDHQGDSNDNICRWEGCNKQLNSGIVKHAQAVHTKLQDLQCAQCQFRGRRDMMKRHVKNNH